LRAAFTLWSQNTAALRDVFKTRFYLAEAAPVSENLSQIGNIGLRALQYLESGQNVPPGWIEGQEGVLDRLATPRAEVSLAAVRPVRALLEAMSGGGGRSERGANPGGSH
jgi:hexosaminidase